MRMSWTLACGAALAAASVCFAPTADARPNYNKEFWDYYPALKDHKDTAKCEACHAKDDKKVRNDYGKAVGEAIGGKSEKDVEKIKAAFKAAEAKKSSTEGKTFGDLIKDGKLPGKN